MKVSIGSSLPLATAFLLLFLANAPLVAAAAEEGGDEAESKKTSSLSAEAEFGGVVTQGNTDTSSFNGRVEVISEGQRWSRSALLTGLYSTDGSETTAQRFTSEIRTDYKLRPELVPDYVFIASRYEDDRFSGYDSRLLAYTGYGRNFILSERMKLALEAGPGIRHDEVHKDGSESEMIIRGSARYRWQVSKDAIFTESVSTEASESNAFTESITALKVQINKHLALKTSYTLRYSSNTPPEVESTDTIAAMTLVFTL